MCVCASAASCLTKSGSPVCAQFGTPVYLAHGYHHVLTGLDLQTKLFVGDFSVFPFIFVKVTKLIIVIPGGGVVEPQSIHQFSCKRSWYKSSGFHWQLHFCQDNYIALFYSIMQPLALSPDCIAASWQNMDTVSSVKLQKLPRANFWHHLYWFGLCTGKDFLAQYSTTGMWER